MNTRDIAKAYGMPPSVAALIAKDPAQFKYWQKCGEEAYNGCLKWVDSRKSCEECLLCQQCCQRRSLCGQLLAKQNAQWEELIKAAQPATIEPASTPTMENTTDNTIEEDAMPIPGKMEITVKINDFPADVQVVTNNWKEFIVDVGGREITITVKPKVFAKLEQAQKSFPAWVAAITGKMGKATEKGFVLDEPNIQVFEKKPKPPETAEPVTA